MIPSEWMPSARMQRVILHWTAGNHKASTDDRKHYHILIEGNAELVRGIPSIALNSLPKVKKGYAAHTKNSNTGSIGVSLCGMVGAKERPFVPGIAPLTPAQWNMASTVVAELCRKYSIAITPKTVLSHAEVQTNLGIKQLGKWDIAILPFDRAFDTARECGDRFRREVQAKM